MGQNAGQTFYFAQPAAAQNTGKKNYFAQPVGQNTGQHVFLLNQWDKMVDKNFVLPGFCIDHNLNLCETLLRPMIYHFRSLLPTVTPLSHYNK